ncbi:hypothetical protein N7492_001786 [Penicillium capsulatum]|uniref:Protein required for cell viability n=1 Tax=Penicillium capsulatum TaxID=69766 RepID=A0A9W9IWD1_9EURO|nr:hypothetical protein N7492_001786 [Penicillium capsulatum]
MGDPRLVREAFGAASQFLNPVLNREEIQRSQGQTLIDLLSYGSGLSVNGGNASREVVIGKALDIISQIHAAFTAPAEEEHEPQKISPHIEDPNLEDARRRRMLHALLDLISLEGIYPSLSSGVGIPLQQRVISVLPAGVIAKQSDAPTSSVPQNTALLQEIADALLAIVLDDRPSIQPVIRGRVLSDVISATAELSFNPHITLENRGNFQKAFAKVIEYTPITMLLPTLSAFLQSETVAWFKSIVSSQMAQVPLRPEGVLQTIIFNASQFAPSLGQEAQTEPTDGPIITVQAIMQISRLLSSVPRGCDPESYFTTIAPQLLKLLDGNDADLKKTASYVIGNGILGKRAYGAPGTVGHSIFIVPIHAALIASLDDSSTRWVTTETGQNKPQPDRYDNKSQNVMVDGTTVELAIERLTSLALLHPNPGLVKRTVYPILLPLWSLTLYCQEQRLTQTYDKTMALLQTFFSISVGVEPLKKLVDNLLWDGGASYTYSTDSQGRVILKRRTEHAGDQSNVIRLIDSLQTRTELFVKLLGSDPSSEEHTGDIFLYASQRWLAPSDKSRTASNRPKAERIGEEENIIQKMISAKIAEKLLENFKDTLTRRPLRVLELIQQIVAGELHRHRGKAGKQDQNAGQPSLSSLANIVSDDTRNEEDTTEKDASESLSTAFSLLSTVLASAEFSSTQETKSVLESIKAQLDQLIPSLPAALSKPATTSSMLLEIQLVSPENDTAQPVPQHISDLETHRQALANLNSNLPPVQAEGFSLLSKLITQSSPVLDIPSTLTLLISIVTDGSESASNEEFIYLNAIKLIGVLASRHPRTVIKTLVDSYTDRSELRSIDQRLKIGESILRTIQDLGEALTGETAKTLGESMVAVAGRRGHKPQTQRARKQEEESEKRRLEREERKRKDPALPPGWSVPDLEKEKATAEKAIAELKGDDAETESPEDAAHAANVVAAWAAGASADDEPDDLRVRASAISILASAVQTNILGLGTTIVRSAVDLALATLTLEPAPESAILRRASAVLILDILKALDTARESRRGADIGLGFSLREDISTPFAGGGGDGPSTVGNIPAMLRALGFVEGREEDTIVRGHLRALIESIQAWAEKSLMWGIGMQGTDGGDEPRLALGDSIAGLTVDPLAEIGGGRPRIEEIE